MSFQVMFATYADNDSINDIFSDSVYEMYRNDTISIVSDNSNSSSYKASDENNHVPTSVEIDTSLEVGKIPLTSGMSQNGGKTCEIPLDLPSGMNGFHPIISISYDSHQGNTILGKGWYISGMSMISRCGRNVYYNDGVVSGVTLGITDGFVLDGKRLISTSQDQGKIAYETEFGNIKAKGTVADDTVKYFEVYYPDGRKGIYGYPDSQNANLTYPLTSLTDLQGNKIEYEYDFDENLYHISKIKYNGNTVEFIYSPDRKDPIVSYSAGQQMKCDRLLSSIISKQGNTIVGTYTFKHIYQADKSGRALNALLSEIGFESDNAHLNPIKLYYGTGNELESYDSSVTFLPKWYNSANPDAIKIVRGRFDYASADDGIIMLPNKNPFFKDYSEYTDRYVNGFNGTENIFLYTLLNGFMAMETPGLVTGNGFIDILSADLRGKHEEQIIKINNYVDNKRDILTFSVYSLNLKTGLTLAYSRSYDMGYAYKDRDGNLSVRPKFFYTGDFNGDGKIEIMSVSAHKAFNNAGFETECRVYDLENDKLLYNGNFIQFNVDFVGNKQNDPIAAANNTDKLLTLDYDGDGKTDLCHISTVGMLIFTFDNADGLVNPRKIYSDYLFTKEKIKDRNLMCGDFNGDGMTDLLVSTVKKSDTFKWDIYYSKGNGQFDSKTFNGISRKYSDKDKFIIQDLDGDGKTDLIWHDYPRLFTFLTRNNVPNAMAMASSDSDSVSWVVPAKFHTQKRFCNIIGIHNGTVTKYAFTHNANLESLLTGVADSHGVVEKNSYTLTNAASPGTATYSKGTDAVFPYVNLMEAIPVVSSTASYLCGNKIESWTFKYTNAVGHRQGKGFCGFAKIESVSSLGKNIVREYNPYRFGILQTEKTLEYENTYEYSILTQSNKISQVNLTKKVEKYLLKGFSATTLYPSYDSHGYPLGDETTYSDGSSVKNEYSYTSKESAEEGYNLGHLVMSTTTVSYNGGSYVEKKHIPAHSKRLPYVKANYKDGNQVSQHTYSYDSYGNVVRDAVKYYASSRNLNTEYSYDAAGRLTKTTDPTGLTESYAYNNKGQMTSLTDCRGEKTTFSYDALGRRTAVAYPDSTSRTMEYKWASDAGALYAVTIKQTGRPDSTIYYDALNREVRCVEKRMDGALKKIDRKYDNRGNLWKVSLPDKTNDPSTWNEFEYDRHGRLTKSKEATGKTTTYAYSGNSVTENDGKTTTTRKFDVFGNLVSLTDASGTATYEYAADGQLAKITVHGNIVTTMEYDKYRRQTSLTDPSLGEVTYAYDSSGNLASQTDADGRTINYEYDNYSRLTKKTCEELTSTYTYDRYGSLTSVTADNGTSTTYSYDSHGRISETHEQGLDNVWLKSNYVYRSGNISAAVYTSAKGKLATEKYYYTNGHLREVILNDKTVVYRLNGENSYGQQTVVQSGPLTRKYVHTGFALPHNRMAYTSSDTIQNQGYLFDPKTGNMLSRTDNIRGIKESFTYDSQNRLTKFGNSSVSYDTKGNIQSKGDAGSFTYGLSDKPYAVTGATLTGNAVTSDTQDISYTSFSRPSSITEGKRSAEFDYNSNGDRVRMKVSEDGRCYMTRHYLGGRYECELNDMYLYERLYLGGDRYSAPSVIERTSIAFATDTITPGPIGPVEPWRPSGADIADSSSVLPPGQEIAPRVGTKIYYLLRDCLGSVTHIVSSDGKIVQELSYDAWGRFRNPDTHEVYTADKQPSPKFGRGYTGHEHLTHFGLINMNARLYDPVLGRFLSPDPYIQAPEWLQNFNRYTYAMNNPLCYVDEDGEFFWFAVGAAALIGGIINVAVHWDEIQATGGWKGFGIGAAYFGIGAGAGALGAAAGLGAASLVGSTLGSVAATSSSAFLGIVPGAVEGAVTGFTEAFLLNTSNSLMQGETFGKSIENGLTDGGIAATLGVVTGGVAGGIRANNRNLNLLDGSEKKKYTGYYGRDGNKTVRYVGITGRDPNIRFAEHLRSGTERALLQYSSEAHFKTLLEARIWEQIKINLYGMKKYGGTLLNMRNEIAKKYWKEFGIVP